MKVNKFLSHIKHSSLELKLVDLETGITFYNGTYGTYKNWVHKELTDNNSIAEIQFNRDDIMIIYVEGD